MVKLREPGWEVGRRKKWIDNIQEDCWDICVVEAYRLACDRSRWRIAIQKLGCQWVLTMSSSIVCLSICIYECRCMCYIGSWLWHMLIKYWLFVCLSVCLCLCVCLYRLLAMAQCLSSTGCLSVCLCLCLCRSLAVAHANQVLAVCLSVCLSVCVCMSVSLSI